MNKKLMLTLGVLAAILLAGGCNATPEQKEERREKAKKVVKVVVKQAAKQAVIHSPLAVAEAVK